MRKKDIIEKMRNLEQYIENVSDIQHKLLKELGYTTHWKHGHYQKNILKLEKLPPEKFKVFIADICNKRFEKEFDSVGEAKKFISILSQRNDFLFKINDGDWMKPKDIK